MEKEVQTHLPECWQTCALLLVLFLHSAITLLALPCTLPEARIEREKQKEKKRGKQRMKNEKRGKDWGIKSPSHCDLAPSLGRWPSTITWWGHPSRGGDPPIKKKKKKEQLN